MNTTAAGRSGPLPFAPRTAFLLCLPGLVFWLAWAWSVRESAFGGLNDFRTLGYAAGKLLGTGDLYNPDKYREIHESLGFATSEGIQHYTRMPFHAVLSKPFSLVSFRTGYLLWQLMQLGCIALFVVLWPIGGMALAGLTLSYSYPLFLTLSIGQDIPILLLVIAGLTRLHGSGRHFLAGLLCSLCLIKFHLFLLLPVMLLARRLWRTIAGMLAGGGTLLLIATLAEGPDWPLRYLGMLQRPGAQWHLDVMPSLYGLIHNLRFALHIEIALAVLIAAAVFHVCRRCSFETALAATLAGSVLVSHRPYIQDTLILVPASLILFSGPYPRAVKYAAVVLAVPFTWMLFLVKVPPFTAVPQTAMLVIVGGLAYTRLCGSRDVAARTCG